MDFTNEIVKFVSDKVGGVLIISDSSDEIVYADSYFTKKYNQDITGLDATEVFMWLDECPEVEVDGPAVEWENIDRASKKYYRINSSKFEKDGKIYSIHLETDITEYMGLNRDITKYMSFFKKLSAFQTAVLQKLSNTFYELLHKAKPLTFCHSSTINLTIKIILFPHLFCSSHLCESLSKS